MKIRTLKSKALSMCLVVALVATYSMVALAGDNKIVGEILVSGSNNENSIVTVNGEAVQGGRTIFTSSTISTKDNSAVVNVSKVGQIKIAPNTSILVSFDENGISGNLQHGTVTVLNSTNTVNITMPNGVTEKLSVGKSATTARQDDDDDNDGGSAWWLWALVFGGAAAAIVIAATTDNNRTDLGGGAVTVSPSS